MPKTPPSGLTNADLYDPDLPGLAEDSTYVQYYDEPLDDALDASGEHLRAPFARNTQNRWTQLDPQHPSWLVNLWWRARWAVYALAFFTPLAVFGTLGALAWLLSGEHGNAPSATVPAAPSVTATPALPTAPQWPPDVVFATHSVPARIRDELLAPEARRGYQFEGRAGEVWTLAVQALPEQTLTPRLMFYGPDGQRICAQGCADGGDGQLVALLEADGLYRVVVQAADGLSTGLFLLTVAVE